MTLTEFARAFRHVREATGNNDGARVEAIQHWGGGSKGDSWCAWMFTLWLDCWFKGWLGKDSPIAREGSANTIYQNALAAGWVVTGTPHVEDGYVFLKDGLAHHIGLVTDVDATGFTGISGNTSEDGLSANGTGVFEHHFNLPADHIAFIRYPR